MSEETKNDQNVKDAVDTAGDMRRVVDASQLFFVDKEISRKMIPNRNAGSMTGIKRIPMKFIGLMST